MTAKYHNDLDRYEARVRAEQEERDMDEAEQYDPSIPLEDFNAKMAAGIYRYFCRQPALCCCLEYIGDNGPCPVHGSPFTDPLEPEGSDNSVSTQMREHLDY